MLTRRSLGLLVSVLLMAAFGWSAWLAVQTARDLRQAQASADRYQQAVTAGDDSARDSAAAALAAATSSARDHTDGLWWRAMTFVPLLGDDAAGVRDLSASLDVVAAGALPPLGGVVDDLDEVADDGQIDLDVVRALGPRVEAAHAALSTAVDLVRVRDSTGYFGVFRSRYDDYVKTVSDLESGLASATTAVDILPPLLGADGPRQYLLVFENNAEIRATGGLPGSWALVSANKGELELTEQGAAGDLGVYPEPLGDLTTAEVALFGEEMGRFFADPNFTPDFPRAAQVFDAFWRNTFADQPLDGVVSIDVVGLSYLLDGLGPIESSGLTLTADTLVDQLLRDVYEEPDPRKQNLIFEGVASDTFAALRKGPKDPVALVEALTRAVDEGRFKVAPFVADEAQAVAGTQIAGALASDDGATPHVDVALNDLTASKMSYYLRYNTDVRSLSCADGVQDLAVSMKLSQTISPREAAELPVSVTGDGPPGGQIGDQAVRVHVFAPFGGTIGDLKINGSAVGMPQTIMINGRPAVTLALIVDSLDDVIVTMQMKAAPGQTSAVVVNQTPSVVPGSSSEKFATSC